MRMRSDAGRRFAVRSLLRLWPYVRQVRMRLFLACVLVTVPSCLGLAMPLVLKWLVDGPLTSGDSSGIGGTPGRRPNHSEAISRPVKHWTGIIMGIRQIARARDDSLRHLTSRRSACIATGSLAQQGGSCAEP